LSTFELAVAAVGALAGAVAALAGFGVGSLLTPLLATRFDAKLAVALVAIPHAIATAIRLWHLRAEISWTVLRGFGVASAAGGLVGAYAFAHAPSTLLARTLGVLSIVVGTLEIAGIAQRFRLQGTWALLAGGLSGLFGGMVGNQGGVRSAGLLGFHLDPRSFVATAAAIALVVDAVRLPIYLWTEGPDVLAAAPILMIATAGVVIGTFAGTHLLLRMPARAFRRVVGAILVPLGIWLLR
jgi:uncharacterized membrane protein YfcA